MFCLILAALIQFNSFSLTIDHQGDFYFDRPALLNDQMTVMAATGLAHGIKSRLKEGQTITLTISPEKIIFPKKSIIQATTRQQADYRKCVKASTLNSSNVTSLLCGQIFLAGE